MTSISSGQGQNGSLIQEKSIVTVTMRPCPRGKEVVTGTSKWEKRTGILGDGGIIGAGGGRKKNGGNWMGNKENWGGGGKKLITLRLMSPPFQCIEIEGRRGRDRADTPQWSPQEELHGVHYITP